MISLHTLEKGSLLNSTWVLIWYLRISRSATVPGLHLCGFLLTPPVSGFLPLDAGFTASCFLGALAFLPVLFVCLVRAMMLFATDRQCGVLKKVCFDVPDLAYARCSVVQTESDCPREISLCGCPSRLCPGKPPVSGRCIHSYIFNYIQLTQVV
jgi:hypothetical protein